MIYNQEMLSCPRIMAKKTLVVGKCPLTLDHKNNSFKVSFVVVDSAPILWLKTSKHLQLIKRKCRIETVKRFSQNFMIVCNK